MLELLRRYRMPLLLFCLFVAALLIYSFQLRDRERTTLLEKMVLQITAPMQRGIDAVTGTVADGWNRYLSLVDAAEENVSLRRENRRLQAELNNVEEIRLANQRLRRLLDFRETTDLPALPAQVIAEDATSWFRTVVIDKGSDHGVREGMPVVVSEGVVGRVISIASGDARVLLITDASSAAAVLIQRNRTRGISRGQGEDLIIDFALRQKDIEVGDRVVTSGTGGIFPKGLVVGRVVSAERAAYGLFQPVKVEPAVDFSRLEEVLVLLRESA